MIVFGHTVQIQFQPDCAFPKGIGALLSLNSGLFLYMFSSFYVKTYKKNQRSNGAAKKELLDAQPKAKPQELNQKKEVKSGLAGYMDDFSNNDNSSGTTMSPLYAKLVQNGHLSSPTASLGKKVN